MDHPLFTSYESLIKVVYSLPPVQRTLIRHTYHVGRLALRIGRLMRFDPYELKVLQFAARMHDIAKFLPEFRWLFFEHPGRFSDVEREQADRHAVASAWAVQYLWDRGMLPYDFLIVAPAIFMIAGHHWSFQDSKARYDQLVHRKDSDGKWDPEPMFKQAAGFCLKLGDFPLEGSRILKVADCFVTATEARHYPKPVLNRLDALAEMDLGAHNAYDPDVVRALGSVRLQ